MGNIFGQVFAWLMFERKVKDQSYDDYLQRLEATSTLIEGSIEGATDTAKSRWELTHVIGMERWMQSRIKVGLGSPFIQEEYDGYRPAQDTDWQVLRQMFIDTRQNSCELCRNLKTNDVDGSQKVEHNQAGPMTIKAWLEYMLYHSHGHATRMTKK